MPRKDVLIQISLRIVMMTTSVPLIIVVQLMDANTIQYHVSRILVLETHVSLLRVVIILLLLVMMITNVQMITVIH
jgi:hypothetical protein